MKMGHSMKMACHLLFLGGASVVTANAATIIAELPSSGQVSQIGTMARNNGEDLLNGVKGRGIGIYAGGNNNSIGNWGINGEGTWTNNGNIGDMTLCGRTGVAGDSFAMVLGGPSQASSFLPFPSPAIHPPPSSAVIPWYWRSMTLPALWFKTFPQWRISRLIPRPEQRLFLWTWELPPWPGKKDTNWLPACAEVREQLHRPIQSRESRFPMKWFRSLPRFPWVCWAWALCSCAAAEGSRKNFKEGGSPRAVSFL